ncbi:MULTISPECIES: TetR/AcrR family transcriptional regulator [unclassified Rhizobium]|uniref:TetR/AcrR family transcriptional regulator n=2 Tax=unclassified Rhizobium TaxID=2613769 RepID=UPI001ADC6C5F|nr:MULTISPECIES: TetR/AcrR family transcriptional regulator [unclassified Rhizobium]MBO9134055.1 TetR/AcrR family transcriptional regulator [Rhizobium sp. B209b/85]QYA01444.1 TetR/AcrR family transcriptional regulator [Rhizobium sp. B21/90]MBO9097093.1 TetR/AcrR family transcriptional regulator [Rhizobium sp. L58/93]MBO9167331.1 TetR/AcrR family transcriptional regulator [Rhizobium sp. L245/93]MBO9183290.1 TetR/AcrR family transcriptional regulator [Rhizobium sp. E27B/91]
MVDGDLPAGKSKKRMPTRDRILVAALSLFNEKSPGRVTTAEIAGMVGINEGNLYYHFRTKESLITSLFSGFETAAAGFVASAHSAPANDPASYPGLLRQWFSLVWDYRFLFRDLVDLLAVAPSLAEAIRSVSTLMGHALDEILKRMESEALINVPADDRAPLLANVWIVATYWAVYLNLQQRVSALGEEHLDWGINQVSALFRPYLSPAARQAFEEIRETPLSPQAVVTLLAPHPLPPACD